MNTNIAVICMENFKMDNPDAQALYFQMCQRVYDNVWKLSIANMLTEPKAEIDYGSLTVSEIMQKIHDFLEQESGEINALIFLWYLARFPVTMCKREVSPMLKFLIGFHYRLGVPSKEQEDNGAEKVSFRDLASIFVRSKATISMCIDETEAEWNRFQVELEHDKEIELEAKKQLIEERKNKMNEENRGKERT